MTSQHTGRFTWGVGPERVCVSGNFNNWSDTATPLHKQPDGSFAADVPLPWGEKQPFKYVVDGEWKVREDEAKEWDAAGNMNNVYTAPHAPSPAEATPAAAAAAAPSNDSAPTSAIPSSTAPDVAPAPATESTNANTLIAAAVPSVGVPAAAGGSEPVLGNTKHITGNEHKNIDSAPVEAAPVAVGVPAAAGGSEPVLGNIHHITSQPNTDPSTAAPGNTAPIINKSSPEAIQTVAANANVGQEATEEEKTLLERAQALGAGAAVTLGSALGQAAHVVEDVTGVNLTHGAPLTVEEAKARGIDVENIEKVDAPTDATSPVGQAPSKDAIADLEEKTRELKVDGGVTAGKSQLSAVPLPGGEAPKTMTAPESSLPKPTVNDEKPKHDLPAQNETSENHKVIPAPAIVAISSRDPTKDRTIDAPFSKDTTGTKPISSDPAVDASEAKKDAEHNPALTGSTPVEAKTSASTNLELGDKDVGSRPDAPEANHDAPPPAKKDVAPGQAAPAPSASASPAAAAASAPTPAPVPVSKDAPSTPVKSNGGVASASSTPASTPAKSAHERDATGSSDVKKRKSGFMQKLKSTFSPKDKEKK